MTRVTCRAAFIRTRRARRSIADGEALPNRAGLRECGLFMLGAVWLAAQAVAAPGAAPKSAQESAPKASEIAGSEKCTTCHDSVANEFAGSPHAKTAQAHVLSEVTCESCHGPGKAHVDSGGDVTKIFNPAKAPEKKVQNTVCTKCHAEVAGPFVYEHPAVTAEGCLSCHSPHGSENAHLLTESKVNALCLECHSVANSTAHPHVLPAGPGDQKVATDTTCITCHSQIHGSNVSNIFIGDRR